MVKREIISTTELPQRIKEFIVLLTSEQRDEFNAHVSVQRYAKNDLIYAEGDVSTHMCFLLSGKVKISKVGIGGRMQIVRVLKPVEYFGYRAYFAQENYVTSASAFETSVVCKIPMSLIDKWMQVNIRLSLFFVRQLSVYLGDSDQRTVSLTQKHIRGRLAEALLFLYDRYGVEADGQTLAIRLSREDLASLSNMTTSNAIRTLSTFAAEGLITVDKRTIRIDQLQQLEKISQMG